MIGRRRVLTRMMRSLFSVVATHWARLIGLEALPFHRSTCAQEPSSVVSDPEQGDIAGQLLSGLSRLERRDYSQEGIPMFLGCQNLVMETGQSTPTPMRDARSDNAPLVAAFQHYVHVLPHARQNVTESDVAKIVELLANEDFRSGGKRYLR